MAVALFGAVVTIILSAQAGLVASDRTATNISQAIELGRCRMSEVEEKQLKLGFPEVEEKDTSPICCNDKEATRLQSASGRSSGCCSRADLARGRRGARIDPRAEAWASTRRHPASRADLARGPDGHRARSTRSAAPQLDFDAGLPEHRQAPAAVARRRRGRRPLVAGVLARLSVAQAGARSGHPTRDRRGPMEGRATDRDFTLTQYITNPVARRAARRSGRRGRGRRGGSPHRASAAAASGPRRRMSS